MADSKLSKFCRLNGLTKASLLEIVECLTAELKGMYPDDWTLHALYIFGGSELHAAVVFQGRVEWLYRHSLEEAYIKTLGLHFDQQYAQGSTSPDPIKFGLCSKINVKGLDVTYTARELQHVCELLSQGHPFWIDAISEDESVCFPLSSVWTDFLSAINPREVQVPFRLFSNI